MPPAVLVTAAIVIGGTLGVLAAIIVVCNGFETRLERF